MDRYKKRTIRHNTVDGILDSRPRTSTHLQKSRKTSSLGGGGQARSSLLDDFKKPEGFTYQSQSRQKLPQSDDLAQDILPPSSKSILPTVESRMSLSPSKRQKRLDQRKGAKKHFPFKTIAKVSLIVVVVVIGAGGFFIGKAWWDARKALSGGGSALALNKELDPNSLNGEGDGRVNVLLMGKGGESHAGGQLTDTLMIASIDPINYGVILVSVPRDLWVKPDGLWPMKINAVYNSAKEQALYANPKDKTAAEKKGIETIEKTIEQYLAVNINYYAMVDFTAFQEAVNIVGGITVNLTEPYRDPTMKIGTKYLSLPAGPSKLDGGTALGFARSRYGAARGDFDRGRNQQLVLLGIKDKVLSTETFANPLKISQLISTFGNRVSTNFSTDDIMRLYELFKKIDNQSVTNVDLAMEGEAVVTTGSIGGQSVVYPIAGVDDYSQVRLFIRKTLKDSFIIKEEPTIIILNASGKSGAAAKRAEELKSYGYNVTQIADATRTDVPITQLVDTTGGAKKYTKRYLELRFNTTAVKDVTGLDLTPYVADYIVVIGANG